MSLGWIKRWSLFLFQMCHKIMRGDPEKAAYLQEQMMEEMEMDVPIVDACEELLSGGGGPELMDMLRPMMYNRRFMRHFMDDREMEMDDEF